MKKYIILFVLLITCFIVGNILYKYKLSNAPDCTIYDRNKVILKNCGYIPYKNIKDFPDNFKKLILQIEDKRFYNHFGIDILWIIRAIWLNIKYWKIV